MNHVYEAFKSRWIVGCVSVSCATLERAVTVNAQATENAKMINVSVILVGTKLCARDLGVLGWVWTAQVMEIVTVPCIFASASQDGPGMVVMCQTALVSRIALVVASATRLIVTLPFAPTVSMDGWDRNAMIRVHTGPKFRKTAASASVNHAGLVQDATVNAQEMESVTRQVSTASALIMKTRHTWVQSVKLLAVLVLMVPVTNMEHATQSLRNVPASQVGLVPIALSRTVLEFQAAQVRQFFTPS